MGGCCGINQPCGLDCGCSAGPGFPGFQPVWNQKPVAIRSPQPRSHLGAKRQFQLKTRTDNPTIIITPPPTTGQTCAESVWIPWIGPLVTEKLSWRVPQFFDGCSDDIRHHAQGKRTSSEYNDEDCHFGHVCHDHNPAGHRAARPFFNRIPSTPQPPCNRATVSQIHEMSPHP